MPIPLSASHEEDQVDALLDEALGGNQALHLSVSKEQSAYQRAYHDKQREAILKTEEDTKQAAGSNQQNNNRV